MTVSAEKIVNRDIYKITYDGSTGEGMISAKLHNPDNGDKSSHDGPDTGTFNVTVATGYTGKADVVVEKGGEVIDSTPEGEPVEFTG